MFGLPSRFGCRSILHVSFFFFPALDCFWFCPLSFFWLPCVTLQRVLWCRPGLVLWHSVFSCVASNPKMIHHFSQIWIYILYVCYFEFFVSTEHFIWIQLRPQMYAYYISILLLVFLKCFSGASRRCVLVRTLSTSRTFCAWQRLASLLSRVPFFFLWPPFRYLSHSHTCVYGIIRLHVFCSNL